MPKRTGAMLETQTTPEPSAAKASLMDGVRTTCRPTRPLLRARKKMSVVRSPLPESWSSPSRCRWSCCWASRRRVPPSVPVPVPMPVPLCQCVRCAHLSLQDDGALSTQTLALQTLQARTTNSSSNCM